MSSNMNEPELSGQEHVRNPDVSYESRDLNARAVFGFFLALAIGGVLVIVLLWGVYKRLAGSYALPHPTTTPIATTGRELRGVGGDPAATFPQPRLQPDPAADLNKFRVREEELLNSYGWVNKAAGKVHIPIDRAIDILAKTGLPTQPGAQPLQPRPGDGGAAGGINVSAGTDQPPPGQ